MVFLFLTYTVFGWLLVQGNEEFSHWAMETAEIWGFSLNGKILSMILLGLGLGLICLIAVGLTLPFTLIRFVKGAIVSDKKAFGAVLLWAFIFVLLVCRIDLVARLLVMLAAAILARLELEKVGLSEWTVFVIILVVCLIGYASGVLGFIFTHENLFLQGH